jgi:hypothetical protein
MAEKAAEKGHGRKNIFLAKAADLTGGGLGYAQCARMSSPHRGEVSGQYSQTTV